MSKLEVDKIDPQSGTDLELGTSGDTITIPAGVTFDSSAATNTLPATVVTTTGTQTLTNKSIATTQLTGTVATSNLGTGTASSTTFLAGDQTYKTAGGDNTPTFSAFLSSTQTASDATWTKVQCNTEVLDSNSRYDADVYYRFTPASTGYYLINVGATLKFTENTVVDSYIAIYKNGTAIALSECFGNSSSKETWRNHVLNVIINTTSASDYYEFYAYGDPSSGDVLIAGNAAKQSAYFNATKIII